MAQQASLVILGGVARSEALRIVGNYLSDCKLRIVESDLEKPWGGYYVIDPADEALFMQLFYPGYSREDISGGQQLRAKILVVMPEAKLSWQYHFRRQEIWTSAHGSVGYYTSNNDVEGNLHTLECNEVVSFGTEVRHRLVGLEDYGVVAEFWKHTDANNLSDEDDIVRVQDDFNRV